MNSLVLQKYAGRVFLAVTAIAALFLTAGCGSSNGLGHANQVGFSNSNLSGTYVVSISGTDVTSSNSSFFAITGTITADGSGHITGGTVDINDADLGGVFTAQTLTASTYTVGSDGRGTGSLVTPKGTFGLDFVLISNSHGLITRFDDNGTGSGTLDLQSVPTQASLTSLAFSLSGADASGNPVGSVGAFTLNSSGTINAGSGVEDFNDNGNSGTSGLNGSNLTGSLVVSASGAGTAQFNSGLGSLFFDVWPIDSTHLKLIETDASGYALAGDVFTQQTSFPNGQLVFALSGLDSALDPVVAGGFATSTTSGTLNNGTEDFNDSGTGVANTVTNVGGSCVTFTNGRCRLALTGFTNGNLNNFIFAAYPSSGGIQLLEIDGFGILQGAAYGQTATSISTSGSYGLNLTGAVTDGAGDLSEVDDIAQFNTTTAVAPSTNMTGVLDENEFFDGPTSRSSLSGSYTPDTPADGRGSISVTTNNTFLGGLSLEYYVVDASTVLVIEGDSSQWAVGMFQLQNTPGAGAAMQVRMLARPVVHSHGALKRK